MPAGFGKRRLPLRHVARVCIFDRQHHRFLGNVFPVLCTDVRSKEVRGPLSTMPPPPQPVRPVCHAMAGQLCAAACHVGPCNTHPQRAPKAAWLPITSHLPLQPSAHHCQHQHILTQLAQAYPKHTSILQPSPHTHPQHPRQVDWVFNPANSAIVRCGQVQPSRGGGCHKVEADKLSLYVELNVAFKLSAEDAKSVPQSEYMVGLRAGAGARAASLLLSRWCWV